MTLHSAAWHKVVAAFVAVATLLAMVVVSGVASHQSAWADGAEQASGTLYQYVTGATLKQRSSNDENWQEVSSTDKLDPNNKNLQLQFNLAFKLPIGALTTNNPLTYQVPNDIQISGFEDGKTVMSGSIDNNGTAMGTYTITKDGLITLTFNEDTVKHNQTSIITGGYVKFNSTIEGITKGDGSSWKFGENSEITIHFDNTGDLNAWKSGSVNNEDGTVQWTIQVSTTKGTNPKDKVKIDDVMTNNAYVAGSFKVTDKNGNDITSSCVSAPAAGAANFTVECPAMNAGDKYVITYTGKASSLTDGITKGSNKATVTTTDKEGTELKKEPSSEVQWDKTPSNPVKNGEIQSDGRIKWTVTVDAGAGSLDGWTLKDVVKNTDVNVEDITLSGGSTSQSINLPYTFPAGSAKNYTVTYYTTAPTDSLKVTNKAILTPPNKENGKSDKDSGDKGVSYNPVTKQGNSATVVENNPNRTTNNWTVTIAPPVGLAAIPANWTYTDTFSNQWNFNQYMSEKQQEAVEKAIKGALTSAGVKEENVTVTFTTSPITGKSSEQNGSVPDGDYVTGFTITCSQALTQSISFTYDTTGVVVGTGSQYYQNGGKVNDGAEQHGNLVYTPETSNWTISKTDSLDSSKDNTEHAYHELKCQAGHSTATGVEGDTTCNAPYMEWNIKVQQANFTSVDDYTSGLTITETLPENVILLNGTDTDNAGLLLQMKNMYGSSVGDAISLSIPDDGQTSTTTYQWHPNVWINGIYYSDMSLSFSVSRNGNQLSIIVSKDVLKALNTYTYHVGNLSFELTVRAGFDSKKLDLTTSWKKAQVFKNTVNLNDGSSDEGTTATQTQTISKNDNWNAVRKSSTQTEEEKKTNILPYAVVVNPYGRDLDSQSDNITLTDTMTYTHDANNDLTVSLKDVKVYRYDSSVTNADGSVCQGVQCKGEELPLSQYTYTYEHSGDNNRKNVLTFTLPDKTPLIVTYRYRYAGKLGNHNNVIKNSASMEGISSSSTESTVEINESQAGADTDQLNFHKVDKNDYSITLSGVKFALYQWSPEENEYVLACPKTKDGEVEYLVTDENGLLTISANKSNCATSNSCSGNTASVDNNVAYKLVEVEPSEGYEKTDKAFYFYMKDDDTSKWPVKKPANFPADAEIMGIVNEYFTNTKLVELPSTGGMGDAWFIGGGVLTVLVASFGLAESLKNAKRSKVSQK